MKRHRDITFYQQLVAWAFLVLLMNFVTINSLHYHDIAEVQHSDTEQSPHPGISKALQYIDLDCAICKFVISSVEEPSIQNSLDCPFFKIDNSPIFNEDASFERHIALNSHSPPFYI